MADKLTAPWTSDQVEALNAFQQSGAMHPFTCGNDGRTLTATMAGWVCPRASCGYTQNWAHAFMVTEEARTPWWVAHPSPSVAKAEEMLADPEGYFERARRPASEDPR